MSVVRNEQAEDLAWDPDMVGRRYREDILPKAMAANEAFLAALQSAHPFEPPEPLKKAADTGSPTFRRYAQDVWKELHYADFYTVWTSRVKEVLGDAPNG